MHKSGTRLADNLDDLTLHQRYFLSAMAMNDVNYQKNIEHLLKIIAEANGVKFKK